jgi:hypothetical protein
MSEKHAEDFRLNTNTASRSSLPVSHHLENVGCRLFFHILTSDHQFYKQVEGLISEGSATDIEAIESLIPDLNPNLGPGDHLPSDRAP